MSESISEITSLVSVPVTYCNVPDPFEVKADFVYNFYVEDEDKNANPQPTSPIDYKLGLIDKDTLDSIETKERGSLSARVPRYVRVKIATNTAGIPAVEIGELSNNLLETIRTNESGRSNYNIEGKISNDYIASLVLSDDGVKQRLQELVYRISTAVMQNGGLTGQMSDVDIAKEIDMMTSDDIDVTTVLDALSDNTIKGVRFTNQISGERYSKVDEKSALRYYVKFNADGYRKITRDISVSNPFSSFFESDLLDKAADYEKKNPLTREILFPSFSLNGTDSIENLQPSMKILSVGPEESVSARSSLSSMGYPLVKHLGYIIEKSGVTPAGEYTSYDDVVSLNPNVSEFIDPNVIYGHTYFYRARQLYVVKFAQISSVEASGEVKYRIVTTAIASSTPKPATVNCIENKIPLAPGTLICNFIYREGNGIRLDWAKPSNPARDIKKYQVFRRSSIRDPFEIIAEYDFTDPDYTMFDQRETIDPTLIKRVQSPQYSHMDPQFSRESSYIYAIASVDAHGFTSNYGTQVFVEFDRFSNKIKSRIISQAGAPKAYPNYYVDPTELEEIGSDRLIEDVIKDSGHGLMRIYFNPTAYSVASDDDGSQVEPTILSKDRGKYVFQVLNLDRQISKNLSVSIESDGSLSSVI